MRFKSLLLALFFSGSVFAEQPPPAPLTECVSAAPYGFPVSRKKDTTAICRTAYFTVYDNKAKIPLYSVYVLRPEHAAGCEARDNTFEADMSLPPELRSTKRDFAKQKIKVDIGHLVNAADLKYSPEAQAVAAILTNGAPQYPSFNRGIWKKLEDTTRGWAISRNHPLAIYVGPIKSVKDSTVGNGVVVPGAFFKIIVDMTTNEVMVFNFKHKASKEPLSSFITSLAEVQKLTGIIFPMPSNATYTSTWDITLKNANSAKTCSIK